MKLITLNTWGGRVNDKLQVFLKKYEDIDFWLFQEVYKVKKNKDSIHVHGYKPNFKLFGNISKSLKYYKKYFCNTLKDFYGLATFIEEKVEVIEQGEILVARGDWEDLSDTHNRDHHRKLQWFEVMINEKKVLLMNTHLTHRPEGKKDSDKRIKQSEIILRFINMFDCPKILAGDFNLLPDTESIKILEKGGMRNLVKEYDIKSTRTELYKNEHRFADYVFVSPEIKVKDFKVFKDVVSDHAPLYMEFDI